jgi:hypothetical protein
LSLAAVRDLRVARAPVTAEDLAALETDVLAGFVLARAAAGLSDGTIASDVMHLEQVRAWFGRPLWDMDPPDADAYFGKVLRDTAKGTRLSRAQALKTYFLFLELRHKVEIHQMTGRVVECPIDEMNRPRGRQQARLRIPPNAAQVGRLFAGWRAELATCRKFAPAARNYTASRLLSEVGLRVNEACKLDLPDIKWDLGRFGRQKILRSKDPGGVAQELYALLIVYQLVQLARIRAAGNRPGQQPCDPDHISFTVVLRALIRSIGEPSSQRLLHDVLDEIWNQPLLTRRPRSKPRERKGTAAFAKACEQHPPSTVTYKLTMRTPDAPNTG